MQQSIRRNRLGSNDGLDDKESIASSSPASGNGRTSSGNQRLSQDSYRPNESLLNITSREGSFDDRSHPTVELDNTWSPQSTDDNIGSGNVNIVEKISSYASEDSGASIEATINIGNNKIPVISKDGTFEWTPYAELHLLNSLRGLRPVGANIHFYMNVVHERFNTAMGIELPRNELMKKLNTYYNFDEALKICGEDVPTNQYEFSLPKEEFPEYAQKLKQQRKKE